MNNVGIDAVVQRHCGDGGARLAALRDNLELEFRTVKTPLGVFGASFARNGVHDVHRAHYLWQSARLQDVFPRRILSISQRSWYSAASSKAGASSGFKRLVSSR